MDRRDFCNGIILSTYLYVAGRAIEAAKRIANLYLDTSSVVFFRYLEQAAHELPPEKLIFGSDGPLVDSRVELYKIRLLRLPQERERLILCGNIRRLLDRRQQS